MKGVWNRRRGAHLADPKEPFRFAHCAGAMRGNYLYKNEGKYFCLHLFYR
jgi:hypothetical protein